MGDAQTPQPTWDADRQSEMGTGSAKGTEQKLPGPKPRKEQQGCLRGAAHPQHHPGLRGVSGTVGLTLTSEF